MMRLFVVNYRFVHCGDVFTDGLRHAAGDLGLAYESADWSDQDLPGKIERFQPDLIFVVHGRKFAARWGRQFVGYKTAVWLVDEPYETDDTARWSATFDTVLVNDPVTLHRHRNAHYLPMCFDPHVHRDIGAQRVYTTGFVGNYSPRRERYLAALADAGLLGYVVGDRWRGTALDAYCLSGNVPAERTAGLYQQTEIVVNIFRDKHNYNAQRLAGTAMNPRIYEAMACGAVVVSDARKESMAALQFESTTELVEAVGELLSDRVALAAMRAQSKREVAGHTYGARLLTAMQICNQQREAA